MPTVEALMTAEEFGQRPDPGHPEELVRGVVFAMPMTNREHGKVCVKAARILGNWVEDHDLGHVLGNDAGVITERDPDTVRGADVAYYSYAPTPQRCQLARGWPRTPRPGLRGSLAERSLAEDHGESRRIPQSRRPGRDHSRPRSSGCPCLRRRRAEDSPGFGRAGPPRSSRRVRVRVGQFFE